MKSQHHKHERELEADQIARIISATRQACRDAAVEAWEDAQIRGLCAEGAFEVAMGAMETAQIGSNQDQDPDPPPKVSDTDSHGTTS